MNQGFEFNCADCGKEIKVNLGEVYVRYLPQKDIYEEVCRVCAKKTIAKNIKGGDVYE